MGRPDRCSARRGDSAQRRRVSANDLLVDEPTAAALALCARVAACDVLVTATKIGRSPGRRPTARGGRAWRRRARRPGARAGGGRSATSRGQRRGADGAPGDLDRPPARRRGSGQRRHGRRRARGRRDARPRRVRSWRRAQKRAAALGPPSARSAACAASALELVDGVRVARARSGRRHGARPPRARQRARRDAGRDGPPSRACARAVRAGTARRPTTRGVGLGHAGVAVLFRVLTGLADGLALKELALRVGRRDSPQLWVPRFPTLPAPQHGRRWGTQRS